MTQTHSLDVPGARLHYEVRGTGPLLLVIGSPMPAADFAPLADALAGTRTVVTYDPRGLAHSTIDDPTQDAPPELRADDVAAIIDAMGGRADVFGSSGGVVTGLALAERHPEKVGTLIAHEPPVVELLPEASQQLAATDDIIETFHRDGPGAAWHKFMVNAGFDVDALAAGPPPGPQPSADELAKQFADMTRFFDHELRATTRYLPDVGALRAARVVVGIGVDSRRLVTYRPSTALADLLDIEPVEFPGDHGGFMGAPDAFADRLREVLAAP